MKLSEKLALQKQLGGVVLFKEGFFIKAYNESAYILVELLGHNLKLSYKKIGKKHNNWIVMCSFPSNKLSKRLPKAVITDFGAQLAGDYALADYEHWLERRCREESIANAGAKANNETLKMCEQLAPSRDFDEFLDNILLPLTYQQFTYLQTWQKGNCPSEVDLAFIESLKQQIKLLP